MDKKNMTIGVVLLITAFAVFFLAPRPAPQTAPANAQQATAPTSPGGAAPAGANAAPATPAPNGAALVNRDTASATVSTLANEFIEVRLTNFGGAVREVAFKKYPAVQGEPAPYLFNHLHEDPILAFTDVPGLERNTPFEIVSASPAEVVYRAVLDNKIEVTRRYRLTDPAAPGGDPYRLRHETTFRNLTSAPAPLPSAAASLSLGTAALLNSRDPGLYLNVLVYDGDKATYIDRSDLQGGGLFGTKRNPDEPLSRPGQVTWAAVKNQFFTSIYTPDKPGSGVVVKRLDLTKESPFADSPNPNIAVTAAARFELPGTLAPGATATLSGNLYVGPQEYRRLAKLGDHEDKVQQFDRSLYTRIFLSSFIAPLENTLLNLTHRWVGNWGLAVILMTLLLKIVSLPFTLSASRSAKRMAKLQPQMAALKEKYKDNPQKQQQAMLELFKEHKVNPVGSCIPILITFPLFIGFFAMLPSAAELRFVPFLWARDLSAPDTVGHLFGFPINIMPLLMGATMIFQMRLTPQPSVDNAQATMMKFMPLIFIAFCYQLPCALALYSTINGLFTIGQQLVINKMRDDGDPANAKAAAGPAGKPIKNVTPKKLK
jgi:YidC/Oxa1 family membrane protein insertase